LSDLFGKRGGERAKEGKRKGEKKKSCYGWAVLPGLLLNDFRRIGGGGKKGEKEKKKKRPKGKTSQWLLVMG